MYPRIMRESVPGVDVNGIIHFTECIFMVVYVKMHFIMVYDILLDIIFNDLILSVSG